MPMRRRCRVTRDELTELKYTEAFVTPSDPWPEVTDNETDF